MGDSDEYLEVVDLSGRPLRLARRSELHRDPSLIHRVVHVLIFNLKGELLLQKRSALKDVAPGKWDTSVGGHVNPSEESAAAARREMKEELGISGVEPLYLYTYLFSNQTESELVSTYSCTYDGVVEFNEEEIEETSFWPLERIRGETGRGIFSRHFEEEIGRYLEHAAK